MKTTKNHKKLLLGLGALLIVGSSNFFSISCNNSLDKPKILDESGNPVKEKLENFSNVENFNLSTYNSKLKEFNKLPESEWVLKPDAGQQLSSLINSMKSSNSQKYQLPLENFAKVTVKLDHKSDPSKSKTTSFREFLELIGVTPYRGAWKDNFSSKPTYGFNLLDSFFRKNGTLPATQALNSIPEFNNFLVSPSITKNNPLFTFASDIEYLVTSATIKTRLDKETLAKFDKEYNAKIYAYQSNKKIKIEDNIKVLKAKNLEIERKNSEIKKRNEINKTKDNFKAEPLIPLLTLPPSYDSADEIVVPENVIAKFKKENKAAIEEFLSDTRDVSSYVTVKGHEVFLQKMDSSGNPVSLSWLDFSPINKNTSSPRLLRVNDYLEIVLNIPDGDATTQKVLEVPLKSVSQFLDLVKLIKNEDIQLKKQINGEEVWTNEIKRNTFANEVKIFELDKKTIANWSTNNFLRFENPDGTLSREISNFRIDDQEKAIYFKGSFRSGDVINLKMNIVDYSETTPTTISPRSFFARFVVERLPKNTFPIKFTPKSGLTIKEYLRNGTVIGKVSLVSQPKDGDKVVFESYSLDPNFAVKTNGDVYVKNDLLILGTSLKKKSNNRYEEIQEKAKTLTVVTQSSKNGTAISELEISIQPNSISEKWDLNPVEWVETKKLKGAVLTGVLADPAKYSIEILDVKTRETHAKYFEIESSTNKLIFTGNPSDYNESYVLWFLATDKTTGKNKLFRNYIVLFKEKVVAPTLSDAKGQDFNLLVKSSESTIASESSTYGEVKSYIKLPHVVESRNIEAIANPEVDNSNYFGTKTPSTDISKTKPSRPFVHGAKSTPTLSQFQVGLLTKNRSSDESFDFTFKNGSEPIKNIVLYSLLPKGRVADYGYFREFATIDRRTKATTPGLNSIWGGTLSIAEWKKYLVISYTDTTGKEVKINPEQYLITRVKEFLETDVKSGQKQYLQRISITLPDVIDISSFKITLKAIPDNDDPRAQNFHAFSKILFGK